uniref:Uncharacterized protein n=1 Tax=Molossus molossus TaxID=27622 RepID=A0A7J8F974_MOLMO|nr:hypothetical protein HJG59_008488 [Molossus molossus]
MSISQPLFCLVVLSAAEKDFCRVQEFPTSTNGKFGGLPDSSSDLAELTESWYTHSHVLLKEKDTGYYQPKEEEQRTTWDCCKQTKNIPLKIMFTEGNCSQLPFALKCKREASSRLQLKSRFGLLQIRAFIINLEHSYMSSSLRESNTHGVKEE